MPAASKEKEEAEKFSDREYADSVNLKRCTPVGSTPSFAITSERLEQGIDEWFPEHEDIIVNAVKDGDTFTLKDGTKIRLWGIDAPESGTSFGEKSTNYLRTLIDGEKLKCMPMDIDKYERPVMQCFNEKRQDVSGFMVSAGMACDYTFFSGGLYKTLEIEARKKTLGMWQ